MISCGGSEHGGWTGKRDVEGLTAAGLLMFGTSETIRDEFPNYALDYQERDERAAERWVDRLTTDGTWSGNLLDFYRSTWKKLTTGMKVPFRIVDGRRRDETSAHVALREALVNAIVHADYTGSIGCARHPPDHDVQLPKSGRHADPARAGDPRRRKRRT